MQSWQQIRNSGRMQCLHSTPSYFNATGSRARFSEQNPNSSIPRRVISASHIMSRYISTASPGTDTSSRQSPGHSSALHTVAMASAQGHQRDQRQRIIPKPHPLECRSRSGEKGNEVSSRGIYAQGNNELEVGGGQTPAPNLTIERHEHFHDALRGSQIHQWLTMGNALLSKGHFANELPSQNPNPYDEIMARRETTGEKQPQLESWENLAHHQHHSRVHSTRAHVLPSPVSGLPSTEAYMPLHQRW